MIIRRIAQGIKDQDWFVVTIEVMIVVVGIFIGLQVDDWNENRKNQAEDVHYLEQLREDIVSSIETGEVFKQRHTTFNQSIAKFVQTRDMKDLSFDDQTSFATFIRYALYDLNTLNYRRTAWQELISSGRYNSFADEALRTKIDSVVQKQDAMTERAHNIEIYTRDVVDPWLTENFDVWLIAILSTDNPEKIKISPNTNAIIDKEAFFSDRIFWNMLAYRYMFTRDDLVAFEEVEKEYQALLIEIDRRLALAS